MLETDRTFSSEWDQGFGLRESFRGTYEFTGGKLVLTPERGHPVHVYWANAEGGNLSLARLGSSYIFCRSDAAHPGLEGRPEVPRSVRSAVELLISKISQETVREITSTRRDRLARFHSSLGLFIRNAFGLWGANRPLIEELKSGQNLEADELSGILIERLWDELLRSEIIPAFRDADPRQYFNQVDLYLRDAAKRRDPSAVLHLPWWVLTDRGNVHSDEARAVNPAVARMAWQMVERGDPHFYLALLYVSAWERSDAVVRALEAALDDATVVPVPCRKRPPPDFEVRPDGYEWRTTTVADLAAFALGRFYWVRCDSAEEYRNWKREVREHPLLRWKYELELSDAHLEALRRDPLEFFRVLCLTDRWLYYAGNAYFPSMRPEGTVLLSRLDPGAAGGAESVDPEDAMRAVRRLLRVVLGNTRLAEVMPQLTDALVFKPNRAGSFGRDELSPTHLATTLLVVFGAELADWPDKQSMWDLLDRYRRELRRFAYFSDFVWSRMFAVDFDRTDRLARQLLDERPLPTTESAVKERTSCLTAMIRDHFGYYRDYLKELYFAAQDVDHGAGRSYTGEMNRWIINDGERHFLYEEIRQDPRYRTR